MGYREVAMDSGHMEPDDDPDPDPVTVGMTRGDAAWLVDLIEEEWGRHHLEPYQLPVYFTLRKLIGSEVSLEEWLDMQYTHPELRAAMPPLGPIGDDREPPF